MKTRLLLLVIVALGTGCAETVRQAAATPKSDAPTDAPMKPPYPKTRQDAVVEQLHGEQVPDPFRWLEDEKSPEVHAWLQAQNALARGTLAKLPGRAALAQRFRELLYMESVSPPLMRGDRLFYVRTHPDKEKAILYWRPRDGGPEHVLLDPNAWEPAGKVSLGSWMPSWDGRRVAFQVKPNAADAAVLHVADVDTGQWSKVDEIPGGRYATASWTLDGRGFYYDWVDESPAIPVDARPGHVEVRFHALGQDPAKDTTVFPSTGDATTLIASGLSRDGKYLFVSISRGWAQNDLYVKRMGVDAGFTLLGNARNTRYEAEAWQDQLYILTDEGAPRQRLFKVPAASPARTNWREIVPEDPSAQLENFQVVGGHLALVYLRNAASELKLATLEGQPVRTLALPGLGVATGLYGLPDRDEAWFSFSSFVQPPQVYQLSVRTGRSEEWARVELPIDPSPYVVEQVWYPSKDGTKVSMFLVHRKDLKKDGNNPVLLSGYGGFNVSMTPSFAATVYPWLEAGGMYALANLRGGGEYGSAWHEAGMLHRKQTVFDDFIAAGEFLVREGYTRPARLAIIGRSNGGLLVGAALTQRPDLYGAVVCGVPLLDMVRYHLFGSGRTWIGEYGTAEKAEDFKVLRAYSPYHAVRAGTRYPPLLMLSADHDDRVDPMHARKFVAAVQALGAGGPAWLRVEANAGHGGADKVAEQVEERADQYAFLMHALGMEPRSVNGPGTSRASPPTSRPATKQGTGEPEAGTRREKGVL